MKIAQFFEVRIEHGHLDEYLALAAGLRPALDALGGCEFIDRFKSLTQADLLLSYQLWRDEAALTAWRTHAGHHAVQEAGRARVFADYRIRIAQLIHEQRPGQAAWQPSRLTPYNDPARRAPTFVLATESARAELPMATPPSSQSFESVYRPGVFAHVIDVASPQAGIALGTALLADDTTQYFRVFEVMRDYGMFERREAPQYYPPPARPARA